MGGNSKESRKEKRGMILKVCTRSAIGAGILGIIIGMIILKNPHLNPLIVAIPLAFIGGGLIGLFSSMRNIKEFVDPALKITSFAQEVAQGDLTKQVDDFGEGYMNLVATTLNDMVIRLKDLITQTDKATTVITESSGILLALSEETGAASTEVSKSMDDYASGASEQASVANNITNLMTNLAQTVETIAQNNQKTVDMSIDTQAAIGEGNKAIEMQNAKIDESYQALEEVSKTVEMLDENSSRIGQIVEVISTIAAQTNLLALNAAIEAARAGEHGRGFAVVAEEVRILAEQSASSASQIADLIRQMQDNTKIVVEEMNLTKDVYSEQIDAVNATSHIFGTIVDSVQNINVEIQEISAATEEIAASTEEAANAVDSLATFTKQSANNSQTICTLTANQEEALAGIIKQIEYLNEQAEIVNKLLHTFTI